MDHNNPSDIVMLLKSHHLVFKQEPVRSRLTSFVSSRICTSKPAFKDRSSAGENLWTIHICKHYLTAYWTELHDNSMKYFSIILPVTFQLRLRPDVKTIFFSSENWWAQSVGHAFRGAGDTKPFLVLRQTTLELVSPEVQSELSPQDHPLDTHLFHFALP